jgi:hypothetical protein
MDELFDLYAPAVPTAVLALDYLGRALVLDGMADEMAVAEADMRLIDDVWADLRPELVNAGGDAEAADYDASLAALRSDIEAAAAAAVIEHANVGLEIVDAMEAVFAP